MGYTEGKLKLDSKIMEILDKCRGQRKSNITRLSYHLLSINYVLDVFDANKTYDFQES